MKKSRVLALSALKIFVGAASILGCAASLSAKSPKAPEAEGAELSRTAVGVEVGTMGWGPVAVFTASRQFTFDVGYTWLRYDYSYTNSDAEYDTKLKLSNGQVIANWHPFSGAFQLSAGAFFTSDKADVVGKPKSGASYHFGDGYYSADQVGTLRGSAEISSGVAPFLGLGWAMRPGKNGLGCFFKAGVLFVDTPTVQLSADGPMANEPVFRENLQKEIKKINDDISSYKYYPILQFGVIYRF